VHAICTEENVSFDDMAVFQSNRCFMGVDIDDLAGCMKESWCALSRALSSFLESIVKVCAVDEEPAL
jgi:hypothetical protein